MAEVQGRIQRRQNPLPSQIAAPGASSVPLTGPLVTADPTSLTASVFTFSNGVTRTQTIAIQPSETSTPVTNTSLKSDVARTSATSTSSAAAGKDGASNLNILIPAIVAPVAAFLVISFIAFWWFMRRRQKKAMANEPEFVMEGMKEKPRSRPITADSNSSTKELVPSKSKEAAVNVREVERPPFSAGAGVREIDFMPPRGESAMGSRPGSRAADASGRSKAVPNFSRGPRPNTAGRDSTASPAPGVGSQNRDLPKNMFRPPGPDGPPRPNNGPRGPARMDGPPRTAPGAGQPRAGSFSRPLGPPSGVMRGPPAPLNTVKADQPSQSNTSYQTSAGAYNGSSPISQYSPIVKDIPKFGTSPMATKPNAQTRSAGGSISSINDQGTRKPPPAAIKTMNSPLSPADPNFSDENMRIARLANNNRLALHSVVATTAATSPATEEPPTPSPRLPPPATRDAPPTNYNIPLPTHEPPAPASIQARLNGASITDRRSVVSGLSDDYVDMEVDDNKSDVSSLDEREKWQMQSESDLANSQQAGLGGYGGLGPRPPLLSAGGNKHDSEASGSHYSLGYYTKDSSNGHDSR